MIIVMMVHWGDICVYNHQYHPPSHTAVSFAVLELVFAHGPFRLLLRRIFSPVPEKDINRTIYAASCRIIGIVHLAIQVGVHVPWCC